jgi:short-subunit dehydrogenase
LENEEEIHGEEGEDENKRNRGIGILVNCAGIAADRVAAFAEQPPGQASVCGFSLHFERKNFS